jgi:class 3 adenylate cyclase/tetratricopeptide (TPR) repeat protein
MSATDDTGRHAAKLEMAHVLFMDIVGYSKLPMDHQKAELHTLQEVVSATPEFLRAQTAREFIRLPTGDGMALVFFEDAEAAARCALEVSRALKSHPEILLRMGVHSGPVYRVADINANQNVAGGGINIAQRVMDCGDTGHILASRNVADVLGHLSSWKDSLHDLGEAEVKHGVRVHLYNLYTNEVGNPEPPEKLHAARKTAVDARSQTKRKRLALGVGAAGVIAALAIAGFLYPHRAHVLTDTDTIVLADFNNTTGDPVFDGTLRQGLAIQLEQSPFLKIMDDEQVQQDLRLMSLPAGGRITNQIAHDICVREGVAATIDGSIKNLGKDYVITLQAITCQGGATLAREQIQAGDKEHVLNALGTAATAMRAKLGESLNSIQKLNRPLEQATTPSLEALQNYSGGYSEMGQGEFLAAVPLFERAIALDPNFAMAYFMLGVAFQNAGDVARSREYLHQAFGLMDRVSEFERDLITATYYSYDGQSDKAIDAYRLGTRDYPRFWGFHNSLSAEYIDLGQFEEGLKEGQEANGLEAKVEPPYRRQLDAYICLDRLAEAKQLAEKLREQGLGGARIHQRFLEIAYVEGDDAAAAREVQWFAGQAAEYLSFGLQAANQNALGQRRESSKLYQRAAEASLRHGLRNAAAEFAEADARADALSGNCQTVRRLGRSALALAMCGDAAQAEKLAGETSRLFPNGTIWNAVQLPTIRAATALHLDQPAKAVELLASASPYDRAYPEAVYLRGLAYLQLREGVEAATEFQKILDHKGSNWGSTWQHPFWGQLYSLSYLGLARASALAGDTAKAKKAFQDFFALWKDADLDIPILIPAKSEYANLK